MGEVGTLKIFHGASFNVVDWHGYRRGEERIKYYTESALLWFAGTVMGEVEARNIFHEANITMVGWHCDGYGRAHRIFHGGSYTVVGCHGYGRGRGPSDFSRSQHYYG